MALTVSLTTENIDSNGVFKFTDATSDYGTDGNPVRSDLALVLFMVKKAVSGDTIIKPSAYNAAATSEFFVSVGSDFLSKTYLIAIPLFDDQASYNTGDITFKVDSSRDDYKGYPQKFTSSEWTELSLSALLEDSNLSTLSYDANYEFSLVYLSKYIDDIEEEDLNDMLGLKSTTDTKLDFKWKAAKMTEGFSADLFCGGFYMEAQRLLERFQKLKKTIG